MAFFIGIACPWLVVALLEILGSNRRDVELAALGLKPAATPETSSYLVPRLSL